MSLLPVRTMLPYGHSGCKPGAGAGVGSGLGRRGRLSERLARGSKGKRVIQARTVKEPRQIEAHRGQLALTDFRVKALSLSLRMRFLSGIITTREMGRRRACHCVSCRHPSSSGRWVALLIPTTTVASHTHSHTVATTSQTHPSQIEIPSRTDQVILFIAARLRIFPLFDRPQPFQKLALSPFLQNGPQDRPQRDQGGHSCYWRNDRRVRVRK